VERGASACVGRHGHYRAQPLTNTTISLDDRRLATFAGHGAVGRAEQALAGSVNLVMRLLQVAGNERHRGMSPPKPKSELLESLRALR
jgi:hypothetical protein